MAMRALVLTLLAVGATAQAVSTGDAGCPCVPKDTSSLTAATCTGAWATSAGITDCYVATGLPDSPLYPADYGDSCKVHIEPAFSDCFNTTTMVELAPAVQATWCRNPWCYVNPCECIAQATEADYFDPTSFVYSYDTCGSVDLYSGTYTTNKVGAAVCRTATGGAASVVGASFAVTLAGIMALL